MTTSCWAALPLGSQGPKVDNTSHEVAFGTDQSFQSESLVDGYGKPFVVPDISVNSLRKAIPKSCFERSALRGIGYVARDLTLIFTTFYAFRNYITAANISSALLRSVLWSIYGFLNGLFATGLWVLAHECGHQAFSTSKLFNDTVGFVVHSSLLVPYFSWKISHGKHHKATGHIERDMVFVPRTRDEHCRRFRIPTEQMQEVVQDTPLYSAYFLLVRLLLGWPIYLLTNDTGHDYHRRRSKGRGRSQKNGLFGGVNHFNPRSPIFENRDAHLVVLSDVGVGITIAALSYLVTCYGWSQIWRWYFVPYLWVNSWLVAVTFLQHTDPSLPHYTTETWNFMRGAAATVDRDFGFIGRYLFHGIIETHVLHHYVSTIPFYNAGAATEAIKPIMGIHYRADVAGGPLGFLKSLWKNSRMCQWVESADSTSSSSSGVLFYRNRNGLGPIPKRSYATG